MHVLTGKEGMNLPFIDLIVTSTLKASHFIDKIRNIRRNIIKNFPDNHHLRKTRTRHVLPKQDDNNPRVFDIKVSTESKPDKFVRLRIRQDNIYLIGYKANDTGNWWELGVEGIDRHLIKDSMFLNFGHNYNDLVEDLTNVTLGQQALKFTIETIINAKEHRSRAMKNALVVCAIMFCEVTRLVPVEKFVIRIWEYGTSDARSKLPGWMESIIKNWKKFSLKVLRYDARIIRETDEAYKWEPVTLWIDNLVLNEIDPSAEIINKEEGTTIVEVNIRTPTELCQYIALLLRGSKTIDQLTHEPKYI